MSSDTINLPTETRRRPIRAPKTSPKQRSSRRKPRRRRASRSSSHSSEPLDSVPDFERGNVDAERRGRVADDRTHALADAGRAHAPPSVLPIFLAGLPAGAAADLVDRRRLLLVAQSWTLAVA